jgi:heme exporter protein A
VFAARRVTKLFGRVPVLRELELELEPGRCHVIFGRNGAGKSTLLHVAATLLQPSSGELFYDGRSLSELGSSVRDLIGLVSHHSFVYADLTVRENLEFYGQIYGRSRGVDELLEWSDLTLRQHSPARSLSRGMQQRLTIARALLHEPKLLLLDEPFTGLDAVSGDRLSDLILETKGRDTTIALATHDIDRGVALADRVLLMEAGRIIFDATGATSEEVRRLLLEAHTL